MADEGPKEITPKERRESTAATDAQLDYENALLNWAPGDGPVPQRPEIATGKAGIETTYNGETTGEAGRSNEGGGQAHAGGDGQGGQGGQPQPMQPVAYSPKPVDGPISHANEEEDMMFGPTQRPEEHIATGGYTPGSTVTTPPDGMAQWYAALRQASRDPEAPPRVKELWALTNGLMNAREGYQGFGGAAGRPQAPDPNEPPVSGQQGF